LELFDPVTVLFGCGNHPALSGRGLSLYWGEAPCDVEGMSKCLYIVWGVDWREPSWLCERDRNVEKVERRDFLQRSLLTAAGVGLCTQSQTSRAGETGTNAPGPVIDTNVYVSRWPFRRIPEDDTAELVQMLRRHGVVQAWAGSYDGVFHKDIAAVNARLAEECRTRGDGLLLPFGSVNPRLPDWEEDLRRCHEEYRMPGVRLHPNYHGYALDDPAFVRLLGTASERGMIVQLAAWMEDERHQHPRMPVPAVDLTPLAGLLGDLPELRIVLLNTVHVPTDRRLPQLAKAGQVFFDLAKLELIEGLAKLLERVPVERVLFGSFSPMFYFESMLLKLRESALSETQTRTILEENARRLLGKKVSGTFSAKHSPGHCGKRFLTPFCLPLLGSKQ
jgi:predicted TIM-barrel fold metal-dependent hydrolase